MRDRLSATEVSQNAAPDPASPSTKGLVSPVPGSPAARVTATVATPTPMAARASADPGRSVYRPATSGTNRLTESSV